MKYAILSDIHANYEALTAVLNKCSEIGVTDFISLGDIVGYNANPKECIALEDSKNGLLSAYRAGCKPIMVPDLWQPDEEVLQIIKGKYFDLEQVKVAFENGEL